MTRLCIGMLLAVAACTVERGRPGPVDPDQDAALSAEILAPAQGATIPTGQDVPVRVRVQSTGAPVVEGVGFIARLLAPGLPVVATDTIRFAARTDSIHEFIMQVPDSIVTNSQLDIYGIAIGTVGPGLLSPPVYTTVVRCADGVCP